MPRGHYGDPMRDHATGRPTFRDAYLVESDGMPVGFVRRRGAVWHVYLLGVPAGEQPTYGFGTREEAGRRLIELASG